MKFSSTTLFALTTTVLSFASSVQAEAEWAGTFTMADSSHTWIMQSVDGSYADPSMKIVLFAIDEAAVANEATIESYDESADALIDGTCMAVQAGGSISGITTAGSCYTLETGSADTSLYTMDTTGLAGLLVYAQHVPTEFERDQHYFKDSAGTDIETVEETEGGGHGDGHGGADLSIGLSCACAAAEYGFAMDCSAATAMIDAYNLLKANGCAADCSSDICLKNWLLVQTHHDFCPTDIVPSDIEDGFHDFDETCKACDIARIETEGAPACPVPNCADTSGNDAYTFLRENGCAQDCDSTECNANFLTLSTVHDSCDHAVLSQAAEEGECALNFQLYAFDSIPRRKCS
jgi:hypothetical protein